MKNIRKIEKREIMRFLKFGIVGVLGMGVTYFFWIFLEKFLSFPDRLALAIGIEIAIISNFILNHFWTFKDRPQEESIFFKLVKFNFVSLGGLLVNIFIYTIFRDYFGFSNKYFVLNNLIVFSFKYFAEFFGVLGGFLWNFFVNNFWTWSKNKYFKK